MDKQHPTYNPKWIIYLGKAPRCHSLKRRQLQSSAKDRDGDEGRKSIPRHSCCFQGTEALQNKIKSFLTQLACPFLSRQHPTGKAQKKKKNVLHILHGRCRKPSQNKERNTWENKLISLKRKPTS